MKKTALDDDDDDDDELQPPKYLKEVTISWCVPIHLDLVCHLLVAAHHDIALLRLRANFYAMHMLCCLALLLAPGVLSPFPQPDRCHV